MATAEQKSSSKSELFIGAILSLLQWVLTMNPWLECLIWLCIAALSGHLVWRSEWTQRWHPIAKTIVCLVIAAFISWQAVKLVQGIIVEPSIKLIRFEGLPYEAGKPGTVNVHFHNRGNTTIDLRGCHIAHAVFGLPSDDFELKRYEEDQWSSFMRKVDNCSEVGSIETSVPSGTVGFIAVSGPNITQDQITLLSQPNAVNALLFMGTLRYRDPNAGQIGIDFCGFYESSQQGVILCKQHNGPLRSN